jgi:lysophospholipase L1-like esterase
MLARMSPANAATDAAPFLPHVALKVAAMEPLKIVAFGSSSTEGIGASSYPSRLAAELAPLLPTGETVTVINRGVGGDQIDDMLRRLQKDVLDERPDLVVWQLGSNDALQGVPVRHFDEAARSTILQLRAAGIDVLLMEPQDCPALNAIKNAVQYRDSVRGIGHDLRVPVLRRYDLMETWFRTIGSAILAPDGLHMSDIGYAKLANAVAQMIGRDIHPALLDKAEGGSDN